MLPKKMYTVVTFHTTTDAMHMENVGKSCGLLGRLIPVPRAISAGCGLSWREPVDNKDELLKVLKDNSVEFDETRDLEL